MTILVIVESGAKGPKIEKILGAGYKVQGCYGHMQDIPHNLKWIKEHAENGWDPTTIPYIPSPDSKKTIASLRKLAKTASKVIIASDMDREGEAIGFHIKDLLKLKEHKMERIVFDQITHEAIQHAISHPTQLRESLYRAQQARRVIDIIFGYTVSPLLWHIQQKLSAGRCQSPALRWIYEKQQDFMKLEHLESTHSITCKLQSTKANEPIITKYTGVKKSSKEPNHDVLHDLQHFRSWVIQNVIHTQTKQSPPQPLTTSALQQKCYQRFKWNPKTTMSVAQKLYEAGHITYMRTDCKVLSSTFVKQAQSHILKTFGSEYVASAENKKTRKSTKKQVLAQEAHEPVRPVHCHKRMLSASECSAMNIDGKKAMMLYGIIYETTMSSLMTHCLLNKYDLIFVPHLENKVTSQHVLQKDFSYIYFPGFRVWEVTLPFKPQTCMYEKNDVFACINYLSEVKHPLPIRPYSSGELLKDLEKNGIGRPSTYGAIVERLENKNYIDSCKGGRRCTSPWQKALAHHPLTNHTNQEITIDMKPSTPKWTTKEKPTDIVTQLADRYFVTHTGCAVIEYLVAHEKLKALIDTHFTKSLEAKLDDITTGKSTYTQVVQSFHDDLVKCTHGLQRVLKSGIENFRDHPTKRLLEEHDDHYYVALLTRNGPAVALLYKNPKRKNDGIFANIPHSFSVENMTIQTAKKLIQEKQKEAKNGNMGRLLGTHEHKTIYAKTGRFGPYLVWNDVLDTEIPEHTTAFLNKSVALEDVTLEQAIDWISKAKIVLRKVNNMYTIKYNPQYDSVYLSKPNPKSRGRPLTVAIPNVKKEDKEKIKNMKVKDCEILFDEKLQNKTPPKKNRKSKQTQKVNKT